MNEGESLQSSSESGSGKLKSNSGTDSDEDGDEDDDIECETPKTTTERAEGITVRTSPMKNVIDDVNVVVTGGNKKSTQGVVSEKVSDQEKAISTKTRSSILAKMESLSKNVVPTETSKQVYIVATNVM
jgi:hypothetical protein